jgi:hypothetical protein
MALLNNTVETLISDMTDQYGFIKQYCWNIDLRYDRPIYEYDKQVTFINKQINNDYNRNKLRV